MSAKSARNLGSPKMTNFDSRAFAQGVSDALTLKPIRVAISSVLLGNHGAKSFQSQGTESFALVVAPGRKTGTVAYHYTPRPKSRSTNKK